LRVKGGWFFFSFLCGVAGVALSLENYDNPADFVIDVLDNPPESPRQSTRTVVRE
jgi:hypothetical protein